MSSCYNRKVEANIHFLSSRVVNGKKFWAIGNEIYSTPIHTTFHAFLEEFVIELIGDEWWLKQEKTKKENQNILFRLADDFYRNCIQLSNQNFRNDTIISIPNTGPALYWMSICYDLVCLKQKMILPQTLIDRLKNNKSFQGAKYEIAVAAILLRSGCEITWIPTGEKKTCELIATHTKTQFSFAVEAKSKHRLGVLNEKPPSSQNQESLNISNLIKKALTKSSKNMPFLIFIDLNLPPLVREHFEKELHQEIYKAFPESSLQDSALFSLIALTNFPFHYGNAESFSPLAEHAFIQFPNPKYCLPLEIQNDIQQNILKYGIIPSEL